MSNRHSAVALYNTHTEAEAAVKALQAAGIDMRRLSIVGRDYYAQEHVVGYYDTGNRLSGDRLKFWGKLAAFWGTLWGVLSGEAFLWMPGLGPILVGGPLVSSIVAALEGTADFGGLSALGVALHGLGIPRSSVMNYESALKANKFLLVVNGAVEEASRADEILRKTAAIELSAHAG